MALCSILLLLALAPQGSSAPPQATGQATMGAPLTLTLNGVPPNPMLVTVTNATPGGLVAITVGRAGSTRLPAFPCGGLMVDMNVTIPIIMFADFAGGAVTTVTLPESAAVRTGFQAVDLVQCVMSEVELPKKSGTWSVQDAFRLDHRKIWGASVKAGEIRITSNSNNDGPSKVYFHQGTQTVVMDLRGGGLVVKQLAKGESVWIKDVRNDGKGSSGDWLFVEP